MSGADAQPNAPLAKSQARLAAVQALYQMDMAGTDLAEVIDEFRTHRIGEDAEDRAIAGADAEHFARVLHGVVRRQKELDPVIDGQLAAGWSLVRVDAILRAILRAGAFDSGRESATVEATRWPAFCCPASGRRCHAGAGEGRQAPIG